ncbi:MAG: FAD-binding oxidoreductase [Deltaproteobacteria bacterium]|nr:FAD-binding oxidoreductase [Deltaproteobacteria bacterium]
MNVKLKSCISAWKEALGDEFADKRPETLRRYGANLTPYGAQPVAVLCPGDQNELRRVLEIASQHQVPLYPISRGKNWGYGAAMPSSEECAIVELSRLNRIIEVNQELAYAVVEPGVTQQQLYRYLQDHNLPLVMDVTGGPPEASLIGNIVERGYGQTQYSDHFLFSSGMEVMLANGRTVTTGFGRFENAKTTYLYKWGIGPVLDGLFTQSNFGIVTKVGVWLMPEPEYFGVFFFQVEDETVLCQVIEKLRKLRMDGTLTAATHLANDMRVLSALQQYPWEEAGGRFPLPEEIRKKVISRWGISRWNCAGGLTGSKPEVLSKVKRIRRELRGLCRVRFISERMLAWIRRLAPLFKLLRGVDLNQKLAIFGLMKGIPTEKPTLGCYWRKRCQAPASNLDPVADSCGVQWCAPVIPATTRDLTEMLTVTREITDRCGFELNVSLNLVTPRALSCIVGIFFDKEDAEQSSAARRCNEELHSRYIELGYIPYRSGTPYFGTYIKSSTSPTSTFDDVCQEIKKALDPANILAPGRYGIG